VKTVIFAWELGAGSGHVMSMRRLAARLVARGNRVVAAVTSLAAISALDGIVTEIHRMPDWRRAGADPRTEALSSATLNDILVGSGLADVEFVQKTGAAWERLFRSTGPALVIADYAPIAALAARGRIPLLMTGNGYTLPPHEMQTFPPLHDLAAPVHREDETLATINTVARTCGFRTLDRLPELFRGDAHLVCTLPLLDPYAGFRQKPADGPLIDYLPRGRNPDAGQVFVYISQGVEVRSDVVAALRPIAARVRIHAPMLSEEAQSDLARHGARIEPEPVNLARALPESRLVVHLGGSGLASEAVLAGVPQFLLVTHVEQHLTANALERAGVGRLFTAYDAAQTLPVDAFDMMLRDETLAQLAAETGSHHREGFANGAAFQAFDDACTRLLR
jgi:UDP:flavonoid glycosyltransferase YjiC (YdhE family)